MRAKQEKQSSSMMFVWGSMRCIYVTVTTRVKREVRCCSFSCPSSLNFSRKNVIACSGFPTLRKKKKIHVWVEYIFQVHCQVWILHILIFIILIMTHWSHQKYVQKREKERRKWENKIIFHVKMQRKKFVFNFLRQVHENKMKKNLNIVEMTNFCAFFCSTRILHTPSIYAVIIKRFKKYFKKGSILLHVGCQNKIKNIFIISNFFLMFALGKFAIIIALKVSSFLPYTWFFRTY